VGTDGANPLAGLVQGTDGSLYATTAHGGASNAGTVFKIGAGKTFTTLYSFTGGADGGYPTGTLVEGTDGNFYGTTQGGGSTNCLGGCGTVFQITPFGVLTTLHSFSGTDGGVPFGGLVQHTSGVFYGTTFAGGILTMCTNTGEKGCGTVFSLDMGLGPFIKTVLNYGLPGSRVQILGTGLTGATSVTFNGTPASTFTVVSDTYMTAVVPTGATTGPIQVTTPTGTLTSNGNFIVGP